MPPSEPTQPRAAPASRPPEPAPAAPPDATAVADAYRLGRPSGPMTLAARGELGRIWRLETSSGRWAVKELLRPGDENSAQGDVAFQEAALAAGVPMPRPIRRPDGRVLAEAGAGDRSVAVRTYSWVDLAGRDQRVDPLEAASILGRLHALAYPDVGPADPWFTRPPDADRWVGLAADAHRERAAWAATLDGLIPQLLAGEAAIVAGRHEPTIRCHLDFNPENVLVDAAGRVLVVDWENSGPAAIEQELASALAEFVPESSGAAAFIDAYRAAGGPASIRDRSSFAMTLAVQANLVAFYAGRAVDPASSEEDRARSEHWIRVIAANLFTVERIDRWLEAVAVP